MLTIFATFEGFSLSKNSKNKLFKKRNDAVEYFIES